jgi:hypothetical protein
MEEETIIDARHTHGASVRIAAGKEGVGALEQGPQLFRQQVGRKGNIPAEYVAQVARLLLPGSGDDASMGGGGDGGKIVAQRVETPKQLDKRVVGIIHQSACR